MHLVTILAFAVVFWRAEQPGRWALFGEDDVVWTLLAVVLQPVLLGVAARLLAYRAERLLKAYGDAPRVGQHFHHRATFWLRLATLVGFAATVVLTRWLEWFTFEHPALQIFGDLVVLSPFVASVMAVWLAAYPLERKLRGQSLGFSNGLDGAQDRPWRLRSYLDFNLRHHVLVVAVPMILILFAADLTRGYQRTLQAWTGWVWTPDLLLGLVAFCIFALSPVLLVRIWRTVPLQAGPLRDRLDPICRRLGLRYRDILVWHSDGMMINAAVMGLFAPVRYVLLSDALLETMTLAQVEAVFGHEAGHVRLRHMQHFLLCAFVGWLLVAGLLELVARAAIAPQPLIALSPLTVQGIGIGAMLLFWCVGFGWLSRRFERQADLFAARCVASTDANCALPCSVHSGERNAAQEGDGVCATGAAIFVSALDRVAVLNGIPHEERSWRHSSIGSRMRFLTSLAGDPRRTARFERLIARIKTGLLTTAIIGSVVCVYYWTVVPVPAVLRMQTGGP